MSSTGNIEMTVLPKLNNQLKKYNNILYLWNKEITIVCWIKFAIFSIVAKN